jgi:hypothetical protein
MITDETNGFIIKDPEELIKTLKSLNYYIDLDKLRRNAIATARKYSWINIVRSLLNLI